MSILRDHILADGSLDIAGKAAAAAVFELAQAGYVKIRLSTSKVSGVRVTRTDKPASDLLPEQQALLKALFERGGKSVSQAYLSTPFSTPVAQTLAALSRALLVREGSIRPLRPRTVYRRASVLFYSLVALGAVTIIAMFPQAEAFFLSLFGGAFAWIIFSTSTQGLRHRRVFRLPKARSRYATLDSLRNHCRYYTHPASIEITKEQLPYELLWYRHGTLRSVGLGLHAERPDWFDGDSWPVSPSKLNAALVMSMAAMAPALAQPLNNKGIYGADEEIQADLEEVFGKLGEGALDIGEASETMGELASDLGDWGGGSDGGGGGDGGDGSGDGGGDGGGDG